MFTSCSFVVSRATLKKIQENPFPGTDGPLKECEVANHAVLCLEYDVSRKQVSIHFPLTRLLASLHRHLQKFNLDYDSPELQFNERPRIDQVLEPVLRQQALIAQVNLFSHVHSQNKDTLLSFSKLLEGGVFYL